MYCNYFIIRSRYLRIYLVSSIIIDQPGRYSFVFTRLSNFTQEFQSCHTWIITAHFSNFACDRYGNMAYHITIGLGFIGNIILDIIGTYIWVYYVCIFVSIYAFFSDLAPNKFDHSWASCLQTSIFPILPIFFFICLSLHAVCLKI